MPIPFPRSRPRIILFRIRCHVHMPDRAVNARLVVCVCVYQYDRVIVWRRRAALPSHAIAGF